jgi:hypothetical protein
MFGRNPHKTPVVEGRATNKGQDDITKVIRSYTTGEVNSSKFKDTLIAHGIKSDVELEKLIRRHESGDHINYNEFGKKIFKQIHGPDAHRTGKINTNNPDIVSIDKMGTDPFKMTESFSKPNGKKVDKLTTSNQTRYVGGTYL